MRDILCTTFSSFHIFLLVVLSLGSKTFQPYKFTFYDDKSIFNRVTYLGFRRRS